MKLIKKSKLLIFALIFMSGFSPALADSYNSDQQDTDKNWAHGKTAFQNCDSFYHSETDNALNYDSYVDCQQMPKVDYTEISKLPRYIWQ